MTQITFPTVIDSSIRSAFVECPRQFYWRYVRNLGTAVPSVDLHAGGAFAKGLETIRLRHWRDGIPFKQAFLDGCLEAVAYWGDFEAPEHKSNKDLSHVLSGLEYYFARWPIDQDPIQPYWWGEGKPAVEFTFAIPLPVDHPDTGEQILYAGRCDMIGTHGGAIYTVDEKTTSQLGASWVDKWSLRGQFLGYCYAARHFADVPAVGAITRGISFLKSAKRHEAAESINSYPAWLIDTWYNQMVKDVQRMRDAYVEHKQDEDYESFDQVFAEPCVAYSGCAYAALCQTNIPEDWIDGRYVTRIWNPLEKNPAGQPPEVPQELIPLPTE